MMPSSLGMNYEVLERNYSMQIFEETVIFFAKPDPGWNICAPGRGCLSDSSLCVGVQVTSHRLNKVLATSDPFWATASSCWTS